LRHLGVGEDLTEAIGPFGQEGFADRWGQVSQFVVGGGENGGENAVLLCLAEAFVSGAVRFEHGIADELCHEREGDLLVVGASAMAVVEFVEGGVVTDELPKQESSLGQREARDDFPVKILLHGPVLGIGREGSPTY